MRLTLAEIKKTVSRDFEIILLSAFTGLALLLTLSLNFTLTSHQQYVYLADSFLNGRLDFQEIPGSYRDLASYDGKLYWSGGPFPALLLLLFVLIRGTSFLQGYLQFPLTVLNLVLLVFLAQKLGVRGKIPALWLAFGYLFGTMYLRVALTSNSWRFAQVVATTLLLLALIEYFGKKRFLFMGTLIACAFLTRAHLVLGAVFFIAGIIGESSGWRGKVRHLFRFLTPIALAGFLLLGYNYARFNNPFETGYSFGPWQSGSPIAEKSETEMAWREAFHYGNDKTFSLRYIPTNLYYYFLKGPDPALASVDSYIIERPYFLHGVPARRSPELTSMILGAPFFLFALLAPRKDRTTFYAWIAAGLIFVPLLLFFAPTQRYFLDIAPFLFIPLARALRERMSFGPKALMATSFLVNLLFIGAS